MCGEYNLLRLLPISETVNRSNLYPEITSKKKWLLDVARHVFSQQHLAVNHWTPDECGPCQTK